MTQNHSKYNFVKTLIEANQPVLLQGPAGTGKTTMLKNIAKELNMEFFGVSISEQTSKGDFLGFMSIMSTEAEPQYISTQFRQAVEQGGFFILDEIDAANNNIILLLNSLENGYIPFPDKVVYVHPDFRLVATANPADEHASYTGRKKLDFSTLDRFLPIDIEHDTQLELALTSKETVNELLLVRTFLHEQGNPISVTMRDALRVHKLTQLNLEDVNPIDTVIFVKNKELISPFNKFTNMHKERLEKEIKEALEAEKQKAEAEELDKLGQHEVSSFANYWDKIQQGK